MCDIKEGFKLCTCDEVDEKSTHWKLLRQGEKRSFVIGEPRIDHYEELLDYHQINTELNQRNCFDFDYMPLPGDRLILYVKTKEGMIALCYDYAIWDDSSWRYVELFVEEESELWRLGEVKNSIQDE